jgi:hypothetical protein
VFGGFAIPRQGNAQHVGAFKQHANHRITTLPVGRRRHYRRGPAFAQAPKPTAPLDSAPRETTQGAEPTTPAQDLSKKLNQSNGIIHPKEVDPAIEKGAPQVQDPNVVPPPATSGGSAAPQPK